MPRMLRFEFPGSLAHIMARGIDGQEIFRDNADRLYFLALLSKGLIHCGYRCLAWALMPNHYHLLVRTSENPMSLLMRPLNGAYARWYNRKCERRGYLFQDRYKSILCQDQEYAQQLIRYIHLNPLRAGQVKSLVKLENWPWCGHGYLVGRDGATGGDFHDRKDALGRFASTPQRALVVYRTFISEGVDELDQEQSGALDLTESVEVSGSEKGWPAVIGKPEFVRHAMERHSVKKFRKHRKADYPFVLENLAKEVCRDFGLAQSDLFKRGWMNARSTARACLCYRANTEELIPCSVIAEYLSVTCAAVLRLIKTETCPNTTANKLS